MKTKHKAILFVAFLGLTVVQLMTVVALESALIELDEKIAEQDERLSANIDATATAIMKLHCLWGGESEEDCDALIQESEQ